MNATRSLTARYSIKRYTLTIGAGVGGGTANLSTGPHTYNCSTVVSVLAIPDNCRILKYWTSSNLSINGSTANPISITMDGNKDLTPVFESSATFTLSLDKSPSAGGNPTANGSSFDCGTYASIQANTDPCYNFVNWTPSTGVTSPTSANTIVLMNTSRSLTANYAIKRFTLSVNASPTAGGSPNGSGTYNCSANASVFANNNSCYNFINWSSTGNITVVDPSVATTNVTMNGNGTVTANYAIKQFTLTVAANDSAGGSPYLEGTSPFTCNTSVPIHANTSACYTFAGWIPITGVDNPSAENTNVLMNATRSLTARYSIKRYTLTIGAGVGGGTANLSTGPHTYNCSTVVSVLAIPDNCRILKYWTSSNLSINGSTANPISITMDGNKDLTPVFESSATFTLSLDKSPSAGGNPTANGSSFDCGTYASIQANTDPCYNFVNWTPSTGVTSPTSANTIVLMNTSRSLTANYAIKRFTLSTNVSPTGTGTVTGAGTYNCSFAAPIQANAVIPYAFDHWSGALSGNTNPTSITMDGNKSVTANFVINPNTVYFQSIGNRTVGTNFSIQVLINSTSYMLYAGPFDIRFNYSILSYQSTGATSAIGDGTGAIEQAELMENGLLRILTSYASYASSHGWNGVNGSGYLCTINFSPISPGTSPLNFVVGQGSPPGTLTLTQEINSEDSLITPVYWLNGSVTVQ
jgi:hypothetical protein